MKTVQPAAAQSTQQIDESATRYTRAHLLPSNIPAASGQVVISKQIGQGVRQTTIVEATVHQQISAALAGLSKANKGRKRKLRPRTDRQVFEARTALNRTCRGNMLRFMYTFTTKEPVSDLLKFDSFLHRLSKALTSAGVRPWTITRERTGSGNWHAHLALHKMVDLNLLLRLWRHAAGQLAGYIHAPDKGLLRKYSPSKVAKYMGKQFGELPPGARFRFSSKLANTSTGPNRTRCPGSPWGAFMTQVKGVHLNRLSRFYVSGGKLGYEMHESPAPKLDNLNAMARLGRYALHVARLQRRNAARVADNLKKAL